MSLFPEIAKGHVILVTCVGVIMNELFCIDGCSCNCAKSKDSDDVDVKNDSSKDAVFEDCSYQKDDEY